MSGRCGITWALLDPNDEDRAMGATHRCRLEPHEHRGRHVCGCGDSIRIEVVHTASDTERHGIEWLREVEPDRWSITDRD